MVLQDVKEPVEGASGGTIGCSGSGGGLVGTSGATELTIMETFPVLLVEVSSLAVNVKLSDPV